MAELARGSEIAGRNRWFADSPLERAGFEPSVPRKGDGFETAFRAGSKAAELGFAAQLAMPGPSVSAGETTAEPAVETVGGPAVETMDEPAMETVAEAMVEMRKSACHHESGPEPEEPGFSGPVRIKEG